MHVTVKPSPVSSLERSLALFRVLTKMMVWPRFSQLGSTMSFSSFVLSSTVGQSTRYCFMTSRERSSLGTNTCTASGSTLVVKRLTRSLKVAEKSSIWQSGLCRLTSFIMRSESSAKPSALSMSSASSNTRMVMNLKLSMRLETQFFSVPCVPMMIWSLILVLLRLLGPEEEVAVEVAVMPVCLPIFSSTIRFCTTSSRVGHRQMACGSCVPGSTRLSIASVKQVVLPLPLCACAMRCRKGGARIKGSVDAWMRLGRSNFISLYSPSSSSLLRPSSSNVLALLYMLLSLVTVLISVSASSCSVLSSLSGASVSSSCSPSSPPSAAGAVGLTASKPGGGPSSSSSGAPPAAASAAGAASSDSPPKLGGGGMSVESSSAQDLDAMPPPCAAPSYRATAAGAATDALRFRSVVRRAQVQ
mmetsp:Transcript_1994/g.5198  ORF Transcript_1994/g.5198 Transcript_1994/m.5198 type:complete len:416 (-) Transcript_1994:165-1412(-)